MKDGLKALTQGRGVLADKLAKFLLSYRSTPQTTIGKSPAELIMSQTLRTKLDILRLNEEEITAKQEKLVTRAAVRRFDVGDAVWVRCYSGPKWQRGCVVAQTGPMSYEVDMGNNALWSRHADQLLIIPKRNGVEISD